MVYFSVITGFGLSISLLFVDYWTVQVEIYHT